VKRKHTNVVRGAMAAKLPVVASKIGSIPEMVDEDRTGFPLLEFYYATAGYANLESIK
jgi:glycosyltransferase involved in cell wall biosynthesis